jgi:hypothetical protein
MLISSGARNRASQLGALIANDFSGANNFFAWVAAIGAVGAVGYYEPMRPVSRLFLFLVLLSMLLSNKGFFPNLLSAVQNFQPPPPSSNSDVGAATADPGTGITGPVQTDNTAIPQTEADLIAKFGSLDKVPDATPIPKDILGGAGLPLSAPDTLKSIGDFKKWWNSLPQTAQTGPSKENPNIQPGQPNSSANDFLNRNLSTLMPDLFQGTMSFFGLQ